ncbi:serine/threonine-protein kinase [Sphaerisporangium corydalis]|uniref:non-specific serine/threonine protein kinase n=1 Tax=Sphaerisporangium corydalis TaxID=1441875 RepID=A0ABV9EEM3_9ACTN|nr:serine/threonine-protein kinase [Sphaerisporangium corydalis]
MSTPSSRYLVGRYRLISLLGKGGMGTVWLASDDLLRQQVAVKEVRLPPDLDESTRAELRERTLREARAAATLRAHPSIVTVHDIVIEDERPWIVMELVQGRSLGQVIREHGPLPPRRVASIGLSLLDALGAAHDAGILHRDIKPPNVLLNEEGRVVLTDFGIATVSGDPSLTQSGMLTGTPGFVAPERLRGEDDGPASDLWSLGATLFAAVEGQPPYARERPTAVMAAVLMQEPNPMRLAGPIAPVLAGLLEKDPARRMTREHAVWYLRSVVNGSVPPPGAVPAPGLPPGAGPRGRGAPGATAPGRPGQATVPSQGRSPAPSRRKSVLLGSVLAVVMVAAAGFATRGLWLDRPGTGSPTESPASGDVVAASKTATARPSTTAAKGAVIKGDPDACDLLTDAQAERLLGAPVKSQYQTHGACQWMREDIGIFLSLQMTRVDSSEYAHTIFTEIRKGMVDEPKRYPGTKIRYNGTAGQEAFSHTKKVPDTSNYQSQVLFRKDNMTLTVFTSLHSAGYARVDLAAKWMEKNLETYR